MKKWKRVESEGIKPRFPVGPAMMHTGAGEKTSCRCAVSDDQVGGISEELDRGERAADLMGDRRQGQPAKQRALIQFTMDAAMSTVRTWRRKVPAAGDPIVREIVRRLVEAYQPERIYLFGSIARGDAGPDSDYDLLLVVPDEAALERRSSRLAYKVLRGTGTAVDVLVSTRSRFDARARVKASLPATVLREGRLLHAA